MKNLHILFLLSFLGFALPLFGQDLVINEFMASNDSISNIVDELGESDDWIELHNTTNNTIDLSGYGLSDDFEELNKWVFPAGILIPANGYLIVWADNDEEQGDLHTSYKLSSGGEEIILSNANEMVLDSITYFDQETNVSLARIPNGTGPFIQQAPTFNANNDGGVFTTDISTIHFKCYPTLAKHELFLENNEASNQDFQLTVYSLDGKKVLEKNEVMTAFSIHRINIESLNVGSYFLSIRSAENTFSNFYFQKQ